MVVYVKQKNSACTGLMKAALKAIDANHPDAESNFLDVQAVRFAVWYQRQ